MKFIIVTEETIYNNIFEVMFSEAFEGNNVIMVSSYINEKSTVRKTVLNILYKNKINRYLNGCFETILKPRFSLEEILKVDREQDNVVIFLNSSLQKVYSSQNLRRLKNKYKRTKFVLLFVDAIFQQQSKKAYELSKLNLFDLIYTFDVNDSCTEKYIYIDTPYSKVLSSIRGKGVYFCGSDKGRLEILKEIASKLIEFDEKYEFEVYGNRKLSNSYFGVKETGYTKYKNILEKTLKFNCILDIVQKGRETDTGLSLRVYEATVYNKVLITNNSNIFGYKLYNPCYMHYIESASDIKKEWFSQTAEYNYKGELSPKWFFEDILLRLNQGNIEK